MTIHQQVVLLLMSLAFRLTWPCDCCKWKFKCKFEGRWLIKKHIQADIPPSKATPRNLQQWKKNRMILQVTPSRAHYLNKGRGRWERGRKVPRPDPREGRTIFLRFFWIFWCFYSGFVTCAHIILSYVRRRRGGSWRCRRKTLVNVRL